ncbi:septal ring lytic transglycosylase RlpA family protein [Zoogloea sp.]|uniref:septal ring lytic transglycosylase RlpA family protein n=1 Tax=Zoogloea sp. TaxID=49181 RepID=UPI001416017E|nr:MAG: septal ring lytic transglycosylase RlpA family protein [Zoogloea sp.]
MTPVATHRRAGPWLAPVLSALMLAGCASNPQSAAHLPSEPLPAQLAEKPGEPAYFQAGLKPTASGRALGSALRFDRSLHEADQDDGEENLGSEAPRYEKGDYSLGSGLALGNSSSAFRERGMASWYGKAFHGRKTSSGDSFDMYALTAAHPTLPIPSYVRVTNLANGRSAVVRINDRGPHHPGRIIDLSYAAAYKLGYAGQGSAQVEIALVLPEGVAMVQPSRSVPPLKRARAAQPATSVARAGHAPTQVAAAAPATAPAAAGPVEVRGPAVEVVAATQAVPAARTAERAAAPQVFLQLGVFPSLLNAEQFKNFVEHELAWLSESVSVLAADGKYRLRVGPFPSAPEARSIAERIATTLKLKPFVVQR